MAITTASALSQNKYVKNNLFTIQSTLEGKRSHEGHPVQLLDVLSDHLQYFRHHFMKANRHAHAFDARTQRKTSGQEEALHCGYSP